MKLIGGGFILLELPQKDITISKKTFTNIININASLRNKKKKLRYLDTWNALTDILIKKKNIDIVSARNDANKLIEFYNKMNPTKRYNLNEIINYIDKI